MKRRAFLIVSGATVGHLATKRFYSFTTPASNPEEFAAATTGVRLQHVSNELLLKLYSRTATDRDSRKIVQEVIKPNTNLYITDVDSRRFGYPGFYRVTDVY